MGIPYEDTPEGRSDDSLAAIAAAAAELGISKSTFWRRMLQYGIRDRFEG